MREKFDKYENELIQDKGDFANDNTKAYRKWLIGVWNR